MVYLIHFDKSYKHANHYLGFCEEGKLEERLKKHRRGLGSRLLAVVKEAGITWSLARIWEGEDRNFERKLKNTRHVPKYCPICRAAKKALKSGSSSINHVFSCIS